MRSRILAAIIAFALCLPMQSLAQYYSNDNSLASLTPQLETILQTDARHWEISTYRAGSLRNLYVSHVSSDQQSYVIRGNYTYSGVWSPNYQDWVDFHFYGRDLSCIEYGHERGCRALLAQDRSRLATALIVAGGIAIVAAANSSGSSSGGGSSGESPSQCRSRCGQLYDPNPNVLGAMIAQCQRRC